MRETTKKSTGGSYVEIAGGSITETVTGDYEIWSGGDITFSAGKSIIMNGKQNGIIFGDYVPRDEKYTKHPKVEKVEFLDENGKVLNQSTKDFLYGKKLKIKVYTVDTETTDVVFVELQGKSKSKNQKFDLMDTKKYYWSMLPLKDDKTTETPLFELNPNWYSDDFEYYDYGGHTTKIKEDDLNEFFAKISLNAQDVYLPLTGQRLKPIAYKRNYEELLGLFMTDNSGTKDLLDNYENKFIDSIKDFKVIVDDFSEYIHEDNHDLSLDEIRGKVAESATKLWKEAVWQNQGYTLTNKKTDPITGEVKETKKNVAAVVDDRPLYWARILMQVILKRHPIFEKDIDYEKSIVKKGTELEKIIQVFEERSRNYDGIDFAGAGGKKKILITGFDPFILNQFDNVSIVGASPNILQSNPSGCAALALHGISLSNGFIQTLIAPVRYTDFDGSADHDTGQGEGVIEKYIKPFIGQVDMIITISQYLPNENVIDMFGTSRRGGFNDNQDYVRKSGSQALTTTSEWIQTTLPKSFSNAAFVKFNWQFNGIEHTVNTFPKNEEILMEGSGGNYLSNEIFYRVSKLRKENRPPLASGHFHISKIQSAGEDLQSDKISKLISIVKAGIENGVKGI